MDNVILVTESGEVLENTGAQISDAPKDIEQAAGNKKQKTGLITKGPYRTTAAYVICGLIACVPFVGLITMIYLRVKAKDVELKSLSTALIILRPVVFVITMAIYIFVLMVLAKSIA